MRSFTVFPWHTVCCIFARVLTGGRTTAGELEHFRGRIGRQPGQLRRGGHLQGVPMLSLMQPSAPSSARGCKTIALIILCRGKRASVSHRALDI